MQTFLDYLDEHPWLSFLFGLFLLFVLGPMVGLAPGWNL